MKKLIMLVVLTVCLCCACQNMTVASKEVKITENSSQSIKHINQPEIADNSILNSPVETLKTGIGSLKEEDYIPLTIRYLDGDYLKASEYVSKRLREDLLRGDGRISIQSMKDYDLVLRYEGYRDIYINLENENFWFENSEESYEVRDISALWDRYIIKQVKGEMIYDDFEKRVLTEIHEDVDNDGTIDDVYLTEDVDIRLNVNEAECVITKNSRQLEIGYPREYYSDTHMEMAHVEYIDRFGILMYSYDGMSISGPFTTVHFYKYINQEIKELDTNVTCRIENIDLEEGIIDLKFLPEDIDYQLELTTEEVAKSKESKSELVIDDAKKDIYEKDLRESTLFSPDKVMFDDYDGDGELEYISIGWLETKFAGSYIPIEERVALVYKMYPNNLECVDVIFRRDSKKSFPDVE